MLALWCTPRIILGYIQYITLTLQRDGSGYCDTGSTGHWLRSREMFKSCNRAVVPVVAMIGERISAIVPT